MVPEFNWYNPTKHAPTRQVLYLRTDESPYVNCRSHWERLVRIVIGVGNSVVHFNFHLIGSYHSWKLCLLFTWLGKKTYGCITTSFAHGLEANSIYYVLCFILCLVQGLNLFWRIWTWTGPPGHVRMSSVLRPSRGSEWNIRFSVYEMMLKTAAALIQYHLRMYLLRGRTSFGLVLQWKLSSVGRWRHVYWYQIVLFGGVVYPACLIW